MVRAAVSLVGWVALYLRAQSHDLAERQFTGRTLLANITCLVAWHLREVVVRIQLLNFFNFLLRFPRLLKGRPHAVEILARLAAVASHRRLFAVASANDLRRLPTAVSVASEAPLTGFFAGHERAVSLVCLGADGARDDSGNKQVKDPLHIKY